jgi:hypothetical protein
VHKGSKEPHVRSDQGLPPNGPGKSSWFWDLRTDDEGCLAHIAAKDLAVGTEELGMTG